MKKMKFVFVLYIFIGIKLNAQDNYYSIHKNIEISTIKVERSLSNIYSKNIKKQLIGVSLQKGNDKICYLKKQYNTNSNHVYNSDTVIKINIKIFNEIVEKLNKIELDDINEDYNFIHGIVYSLSFGNENYSIHLKTNKSIFDNETKGVKIFANVFNEIWALSEN